VQFFPNAQESLAKIVGQRFGVALSFGPLFVLANSVSALTVARPSGCRIETRLDARLEC